MNFTFTWIMDKLGYMPKIDMQVGKVNIDAAWPFPEEVKKKPAIKKPAAKRTVKKAK